MDRTRTLGVAMGVIRAGVGGALLVAPRWAGRIWVGSDADGDGTVVFARAIGARDVVLGASTLAAVSSRQQTTWMLRAGVAADLADAGATLLAWQHLDGRRRVAMPLIAASVGGLGAFAAALAQAADQEDEPMVDDDTPVPGGRVDGDGVADDAGTDGELDDDLAMLPEVQDWA